MRYEHFARHFLKRPQEVEIADSARAQTQQEGCFLFGTRGGGIFLRDSQRSAFPHVLRSPRDAATVAALAPQPNQTEGNGFMI